MWKAENELVGLLRFVNTLLPTKVFWGAFQYKFFIGPALEMFRWRNGHEITVAGAVLRPDHIYPLLLKDKENPLQHWSGRMAECLSLSPSQPGTSGWEHEPSMCKSWASGVGVFVPRNRNEGEKILHIFSVFWSESQLENEITHPAQQQSLKYVLADSEKIKWSRKETEYWWHHTSKERLPNGKNTLKMGLNLTNSKILESD